MKNPNGIKPVILAGGSGTRLWPLSREEMPKQFCKIKDGKSLFQNTLLRVSKRDGYDKPVIITNEKHAAIVTTQLMEIEVSPDAVILEPFGKDTCAAIGLAVQTCDMNTRQTMMVMPSDHVIGNEDVFHTAVKNSGQIASKHGSIVTMGIKPHHPETGYGYLLAGDALEGETGYQLSTFIEKPSFEKASELIKRNDVFWNAGIFVFDPRIVWEEIMKFQPEMAANISISVADAKRIGHQIHPCEKAFGEITPISFDYGVMEHTEKAALVSASPEWSDLGSWNAMWEISEKDGSGNVECGSVYSKNSENNFIMSDGPTVGVTDLKDIVVVANRDAILVTSRENTQNIKGLVEEMKQDNESTVSRHGGEDRPWGRFDSLDRGDMHQVKRIKVTPGGRLSLQYHHHRAEHWVVVKGMATVTVGKEISQLIPGQQVFIPQGATHRLENLTDEDVEIIEVQYGNYLGEDDIVRVEDVYGRDPGMAVSEKSEAA